MAKGMADRHPLLCVCSVFAGLILRDGVQIRLYIFGFLGPLGLDSGRFATPFLKCVSSNLSKKTNNPNPSPIKKIWFGLYLFGAGGGTRTHTVSLPTDFESVTSTNSITPALTLFIISDEWPKFKRNLCFRRKIPDSAGRMAVPSCKERKIGVLCL